MAFLASDKKHGVIYLDHREFTFFTDREPHFPVYLSGDGNVLAYLWRNPTTKESCVVVDGKESPPFQIAGPPSLSRDGRVVAHLFTRDDESYIRQGDREEGPFDWASHPVVSRDGSTMAYAFGKNGNWLSVGGKKTPLVGNVHSLFISSNGKEVGLLDRVNLPEGGYKTRAVAFGKTGETFSTITGPVFSPTRPLIAYGATQERQKYVVIGDTKHETPNRVGEVVFSPDGRKVGYGARIGRELWWKVIDVPKRD